MDLADNKVRQRAAIVCNGDPRSFRTWSGTPHHMLEALEEQFDVVAVVQKTWEPWFNFARKAVRRLTAGTIDIIWSPPVSRVAGKSAIAELHAVDCEWIFAIGVTSICYHLLNSGKDVVFISDATTAVMIDYNPRHTRLASWLKKSALMMETACIQGSTACLFPSEWARGSAIADHGGDPGRIRIVPWGANLNSGTIVQPGDRNLDEWRILFVGVDWLGKGGDIALEAVQRLRRAGRKAHLDVVGSAPETTVGIEGVTFHGFLDKKDAEQGAKLNELFRQAHIFFLPTRFDALGIVFAEAASFGLPAVSYHTGGVPDMVVDGETGVLLPEGAGPELFATAIAGLLSDRETYDKMSAAALARSGRLLNWPAWGRGVREALDGIRSRNGGVGAAIPESRTVKP